VCESAVAARRQNSGTRRSLAASFGTSALLGTVDKSLRMVSLRGSKQCHTRTATRACGTAYSHTENGYS